MMKLLILVIFFVGCREVDLPEATGEFNAQNVYQLYKVYSYGQTPFGSFNSQTYLKIEAQLKYGGESGSDLLLPYDASLTMNEKDLSTNYSSESGQPKYVLTSENDPQFTETTAGTFTLAFSDGSQFANSFSVAEIPTRSPESLTATSPGNLSFTLSGDFLSESTEYAAYRFSKSWSQGFQTEYTATFTKNEGSVEVVLDVSSLNYTETTTEGGFYLSARTVQDLSNSAAVGGTIEIEREFYIDIDSVEVQ